MEHLTELERAAQQALETMTLAREALRWIRDVYCDTDDEAGECASCGERSYKPHAKDCKRTNAISAISTTIKSLNDALTNKQAELAVESGDDDLPDRLLQIHRAAAAEALAKWQREQAEPAVWDPQCPLCGGSRQAALAQQAEPVRRESAPGEQPNALRIADELSGMDIRDMTEVLADDAAAELRWLHGELQQAKPVAEPVVGTCDCHRCIKEYDLRYYYRQYPVNLTRMILCPTCGNKRRPKASDHRLDCTSSNEPGQPGSVYTEQAEPVVERRPAGWVKQQTVPMDGLVSDVEYLRLFEEARKGSDRPAGLLRGIRAVIAAYESAKPGDNK